MAHKNSDVTGIKKFLLHLHPKKIDKRALKFSRTFGLGGISALLIVVLFVTGILLRFTYIPSTGEAYQSILRIETQVLFGTYLRGLHNIAGKLLVVVCFLHLVRVFYSQSFYGKRAKNWVYGILLFILVLAANFTGYLLPWDQLAYWAITVVTELVEYIPYIGTSLANFIRGGESVDGDTLLIFYNLHTGIIPIAFIVLLSLHFWLVRKAGGVALPKLKKEEKPEKVSVSRKLVPREIIVVLFALAILSTIAAMYQAPLLEEANPSLSPNPAKAPWYFLGIQELLLHMHPLFSALIIPVCIVILLVKLPFIIVEQNVNTGTWFHSQLGRKIVLHSVWISGIFTFGLILCCEYFIHADKWFPYIPVWVSTGIFPLALYSIPMATFFSWLRFKLKASLVELMQGIVTVILTSYIVLMAVGIFFRGEGMQLTF